jgi:hypothetical protein
VALNWPKRLSSIKLTTAAPQSQTFEGTLFTACPILNVVAINTRPAATGDSGDYHIIPISRVQNFQITSLASSQQQSSVLPPVDTKRLKEREKARIAQLKEQAADRGKGVSKEAQAIYDSLKRVWVHCTRRHLLIFYPEGMNWKLTTPDHLQ